MSNKRPRLPKAGKKPKKAEKKRTQISISALALRVATLLGGIAAVVIFLPRPTVEPNGASDISDPLSAPFTIVNSSFVPLKGMDILFGINQLATEPAEIDPNMKFTVPFGLRITTNKWQHHRLLMDERYTIALSEILEVRPPARLSGADIGIIVAYSPWILPLRREKRFRLMSHKEPNGQLLWYSHPLD